MNRAGTRPGISPGSGFERMRQAGDAELRVEALVDLAAAVGTGAFEKPVDRTLVDLTDSLADDGHRPHFSCAQLAAWIQACWMGPKPDHEEMGLGLIPRNLLGLVVRFATPVREFHEGEDTAHSYSWGSYHTTWIYADTYAEAWALGLKWVETCEIHDREAVR